MPVFGKQGQPCGQDVLVLRQGAAEVSRLCYDGRVGDLDLKRGLGTEGSLNRSLLGFQGEGFFSYGLWR